MRNLLVTGGAGFIGANFVNFWLKHHPGDRMVVLDVVTYAGNPSSLEQARARSEFTFVRGDIRSVGLAERLLREHEVTTVVHFAAESHVDRSIEGPDVFIDTNVARHPRAAESGPQGVAGGGRGRGEHALPSRLHR